MTSTHTYTHTYIHTCNPPSKWIRDRQHSEKERERAAERESVAKKIEMKLPGRLGRRPSGDAKFMITCENVKNIVGQRARE